jgi:NAD(P)-dependent dehydrogenase (short-subunit alcohol dehydrogenase family)
VLSPAEFDRVNNINYRGLWLCCRAELRQMLRQEPLPTHDGRAGNRGAIVNVASNLGTVSMRESRKFFSSPFLRLLFSPSIVTSLISESLSFFLFFFSPFLFSLFSFLFDLCSFFLLFFFFFFSSSSASASSYFLLLISTRVNFCSGVGCEEVLMSWSFIPRYSSLADSY